MDRLNPLATGLASALMFTVIYALCAAAFALWPGASHGFFNAWFHGLDLAALQAGAKPFTFGVFIYGWLGIAVSGFAAGALYAVSYNLIRRLPGCR